VKAATGRTDWEQNHAKIRDAMLALIAEKKGKIPSQEEIAAKSGLSRITVQRHMQDMELSEIAHPFRALADTVLLGLANRAVKGDTAAAKLYFKLTFGREADDREE
jgi:DNA-binding transcriptional MocR family regulator